MAEDGEVVRATARVGVHAGYRHHVIDAFGHADAGHHAHVTEERGDKDGLDDDEPQDGGGAGTDGFADAEKGIDNYDSYSKESTLFGKFTTTSEKTEYLRGYKDGHDDGK